MEDTDITVVGAGPAGLSAARAAAELGANVILFEKNNEIAAHKPCGEGVSQATFETAGVRPKAPIVLMRTNAAIFAPDMKCVEINQQGFSISKTMFLQELASKAAQAGAQIRVGRNVESIAREGGHLVVNTAYDRYTSDVVIGADGCFSTVAKSLGLSQTSELIPCVQYKMAGCNLAFPESARFYVGNKIAPKGYAWILPRGESIAHVGIGVRGVPAKTYLDRFMKMFGEEFKAAQIIDFRAGVVPIGGLIEQNIADNVILIGDAAGTVTPLTGAGIHSSIAAGREAGEVAASAVAGESTSAESLSEFKERYEPWARRIRRSLGALRAVERLSDRELNLLGENLDEDDILDIANGVDPARVARKLMRHPVLAAKLAIALEKL